MHAMAIIAFNKKRNNSFQVPDFQGYKAKIMATSDRVDEWHVELNNERRKTLKDDGDFIRSPYVPLSEFKGIIDPHPKPTEEP